MSKYLKVSIALITLLTANLASAFSANPSKTLRLNKVDSRIFHNVTVAVSYSISGHRHTDSELIGDWANASELVIRQTAGSQDSNGVYHGDFLQRTSVGSACSSNCTLTITKTDTRIFTDVEVEISFTVGGSSLVHYDWEAVAIPGTLAFTVGEDFLQNLDVDGRGASWNGYNYVGNLLKTPTQISSFFWGSNGVTKDSEVWAEGFTPFANVQVIYDSPVYGAQLLYPATADANGIVHGVFTGCSGFLMRLEDSFHPQAIRVVDSAGRSASLTVNSIKACSYLG